MRRMKVTTAEPVKAPIKMLKKSKFRSSRRAKREAHERHGACYHRRNRLTSAYTHACSREYHIRAWVLNFLVDRLKTILPWH